MAAYSEFIGSPSDLVTSHEETRAGFLAQALAKTEKAYPFVSEATELLEALHQVEHPEDLLNAPELRSRLIAASGFSDKAFGYMTADELRDSVVAVVRAVSDSAGDAFREELVYRYLLTRGDSLGGKMRNWTGAVAQRKFTAVLLSALSPDEQPDVETESGEHLSRAELGEEAASPESLEDNESEMLKEVAWPGRLLVFNKKSPIVGGSNVDLILFANENEEPFADLIRNPLTYLACGELKGGIDPAGADEHWKTTKGGLDRIREAFEQKARPRIFFVGAAISVRMANEIYVDLQSGKLAHAANLTILEQVRSLVDWLVTL